MSKIGLFGSSFNPPHLGHLAVIQDLATHKDTFDEIWLVPVYAHAFAKNASLAPFKKRLTWLHAFLNDLSRDNVRISTVERDLNKTPSFTIDTVEHLKSKHPADEFILIAGSDVKNDLSQWHGGYGNDSLRH